MTQHDISGKTVLVAEVDNDVIDPWLINNNTGLNWYCSTRTFGEEGFMYSKGVKLPSGNWQLLGISDSLTEEKAREIVPWFELAGEKGYQDYSKEYLSYGCKTAIQSFHSWLTSRGYDLNKKYAILIQQKNQNP